MKCFLLLSLFVFAYCEVKEEKNVLVATTDNWDEIVNAKTTVLVEFYAPRCGHCKALEPEFTNAAAKLKEEKSEVKLAKVDATVETKLANKFGVESYPTLKFFKNGVVDEYGGRTAEEIIAWLKKKSEPAATPLETADAVKEFTDKREVAVLGFFTNKDSDLAKIFLKVADAYDGTDFGISSPANSGDLAVTKDKIVVVKKFDDLRADYNGAADAEDIIKFVDKESIGFVTEFTDSTQAKLFNGDIKVHLLLFISKKAKNFNDILDTFTEAAKKFKGKILFIYIDIDKKDNERFYEFFQLKPENAPILRLVNVEGDVIKYKPETTDITLDSITNLMQTYFDGKLNPIIMSEEIPEDWDKNPVKVLVGNNFRDVAMSNEKNVLVKFYAPWCDHCKKLAPIWDQLGENYKDHADIFIAKIDSTANEVPGIQVQNYPTIKYFLKKGEVVDYTGGHTLDNFVKFLESGGKVQEGKYEQTEDINEQAEPEDSNEQAEPEGGDKGIPKEELAEGDGEPPKDEL